MKKGKNLILILLAVVLLIGCTTAFIFGESVHITREQFFSSVINILDLPEADETVLKFTDADQISPECRESIAKGVKSGLIYGKNDGSLDPGTEITLAEVNWFLARIDLKPKTITKYVSGGTKIIEKIIEVPVPVDPVEPEDPVEPVEPGEPEEPAGPMCDAENGVHYYVFDGEETGCYVCLCGENEAPVGTKVLVAAEQAYEITEENVGELTSILAGNFDCSSATVMDDYFNDLSVGFNANCYELKDGELTPIGFAEMFKKYDYDWDTEGPVLPILYHMGSDEIIDGIVVVLDE